MFVEINGNPLYVQVLGPDDAPTLIAHHGAPGLSWHADTRAEYEFLAEEFRVVVYDARGSGTSGTRLPLTNRQWVEDLDGLRRWLGAPSVYVAGSSYGGCVAMDYAVAYPQHTDALVLRGAAAHGRHLVDAGERAMASDRTSVDAAMWQRITTGGLRDNDDLADVWRTLLPLYDVNFSADELRRTMSRTHFHYETQNAGMDNWAVYDATPDLPSITCPTLVVVGRHDWIAQPKYSQQIADLVPGARLAMFENSGHAPHVDEREAFERCVGDFLRGVRDGQGG